MESQGKSAEVLCFVGGGDGGSFSFKVVDPTCLEKPNIDSLVISHQI